MYKEENEKFTYKSIITREQLLLFWSIFFYCVCVYNKLELSCIFHLVLYTEHFLIIEINYSKHDF